MQAHHYGPNFHLIDDSFLQTLLTELCQAKTTQPQINRLVQLLYNGLIVHTANTLFPKNKTEVKTRMGQTLSAETLAQDTKAVTVNLARAGTFPSHICYEYLHWFLNAENVRQDHIFAARNTDSSQTVTGTNLGSFKIGGGIENSYVLFPDPMGATGGTIETAIEYYKNEVQGPAKSFIALHLIVTPEYLKRIQTIKAPLQVFALRVDRGLSSEQVLNSPLGLYWDQEKGLNDKQYIIPGAGGLGELLNNSFV
ncbi:uracil phosphoribosyltransferase [Bdellovibrio sp. qaytius]|nr:uracil phosphoribosyltransferase [Bdellovibrio sp. qaytius]